ncbi:MAG TPA: ASKHA domain-containing protein [Chloroflexota bacterium]
MTAANPVVRFLPQDRSVEIEAGTNLLDALKASGVDIDIPCGGQGRCGRCKVQVATGKVDCPPTALIKPSLVEEGWVLACQSTVTENVTVMVPPQRGREVPVGEAKADRIAVPAGWQDRIDPMVGAVAVTMEPPSLEDNTDDLSRLRRELAKQGIDHLSINLRGLRELPEALRSANWQVTAFYDESELERGRRLIGVAPGDRTDRLFGVAVDIGTTTVVVYLIDLKTARVLEVASAYNAQIARGEDVISRIIYSLKGSNLRELQTLVVSTINGLLAEVLRRAKVKPEEVLQVVVAGNTTMSHLFMRISPKYVREQPYIPAVNHYPSVPASEFGLDVHPNARVLTLPGVGSYVGGDITAGVLSSGMWKTDKLTMFIDVGTNGEIVLGNADWLITCACSAGPAFEGAGVQHGMRATRGAIEKVKIDRDDFEPLYHVIGEVAPEGICGSGMIDLLAEMFISGVIDKGGRMNLTLGTPRIRQGDHGAEYVVAWGGETGNGEDIVVTEVDVNNLMRTKSAIYAGFSVLLNSVGMTFDDIEQVLIGGGFGRYINVEKAIQIGLLPDLPWEKFSYLGNTSALGAYACLISSEARAQVEEVAKKMTYLELSADNRFMEEYISGLFLPHTNVDAFPSVTAVLSGR